MVLIILTLYKVLTVSVSPPSSALLAMAIIDSRKDDLQTKEPFNTLGTSWLLPMLPQLSKTITHESHGTTIVLVKALLLLCLDQRHRRHGVLSIAFCREFCCGLHPPMVPALQTVDHPGAFSIGRYFEMIIPGNDFLLFVLVGESELTDVLLLDHVWG